MGIFVKRIAGIFAAVAFAASAASAAELKVIDVKASLFWEHTGKLSDNIIGAPPFQNLAKGGGPDHDSASAVLFDIVFQGEKNVAPKYATATVDIVQTSRTGQSIVTHKAFTNFVFGADGIEHKALLIENATCMPLTLEVRAGKASKVVKLDFQCGA